MPTDLRFAQRRLRTVRAALRGGGGRNPCSWHSGAGPDPDHHDRDTRRDSNDKARARARIAYRVEPEGLGLSARPYFWTLTRQDLRTLHPSAGQDGVDEPVGIVLASGTCFELDDTTSPLLGITRSGELLGARPPAGVTGPGFQLRQGLPCIHRDGQAWCREVDDDKDVWGPWTLAAATESPRLPWWVTANEKAPNLIDASSQDPRTPAKIIAMDDIPCVRYTDGSVACLRRGATSTTLAPVPAPRTARTDICDACIAPNPSPLTGAIDKGEVHCIGKPTGGRARGRWGGFGATPQPVVGLEEMTGLATLPGFWLTCAGSTPIEDHATTPSARTDRKDPLDDPSGLLADALALGRAACRGDDDALRYLNAALLGRPKRR